MSVSVCVAGKSRIAIEALRLACAARPGEVIALCNRTDDGEDRWQPSFKRYAQAIGVPTVAMSDLYDIEDLVFLSTEFDRIVRPARFAAGSRLYNIHFSLLPAYKGMYTSAHPILNGERESGCTLHEIDPGIDTGAIIDQVAFALSGQDTAKTLYARYLDSGIALLRSHIGKLLDGPVPAVAQPVAGSSYYSPASIDYARLSVDLRQTCDNVTRQIRAFNHRAFQLPVVHGHRISAARPLASSTRVLPGTILDADDSGLTVATIDYDCHLTIDRFDDLLAAAAAGEVDRLEAILANDPGLIDETNNRGWTPLIVAAFQGTTEAVRRLIDLGADPAKPNEKGTTPLMYAKDAFLRLGDANPMRTLLSAGADADARDMWGKSLLDYVEDERKGSVVAVLRGDGRT